MMVFPNSRQFAKFASTPPHVLKTCCKLHNSMKMILTLIILSVFTTMMLAGIFPVSGLSGYNNSKAPTLSLPDAYHRAIMALGDETNQFHCLKAEVTTIFSPAGEWSFTFYSTN